MKQRCLSLYVLLCFLCVCPVFSSAGEHHRKDNQGRDYWVYTPETLDPDKTYTLVLGVHSYRGNGKGAGGLAKWAQERDCIVFSPTYDSNGYQYLQQGSDQQTLDLIKQLRQEYNLRDKMFVAGFSGGAQFAHRFAMKYPELVAGCAAHSGGTWATGDYAERAVPNPKARGVLFVISCGEQDTRKSFDDAPMGRFEWAKKYEAMLGKGGFIYDAKWIPDTGHRPTSTSRQMTEDCYHASIHLLPTYKAEQDKVADALRRRDYAAAWATIKARLDDDAANDTGIIGKVHQLHVDVLAKDIDRIDRWAQRQVRLIVRENKDPDHRRAALQQHAATFDGLSKTAAAVDEAIAQAG